MSKQHYTDELEIDVLEVAPSIKYKNTYIGPDEIIAIEGSGTFERVSLKEKIEAMTEQKIDLKKFTRTVHRESTRRGHASLSTSAVIFSEVRNCSRLLTMLLVSPPYGSYLQESQRRSIIKRDSLLIPAELKNKKLESQFIKSLDNSLNVYYWLIDKGIKLEDARYVIPLACSSSLFSSASLESFIYLISKVNKKIGIVPIELNHYVNKLLEFLQAFIPELLNARLDFCNSNNYYPMVDPLRETDYLISRVINGSPKLGAEIIKIESIGRAEEIVSAADISKLNAYNNFFRVVTCEVLSLAAYHQAIRHRTVHTMVEPIPEAVERAKKNRDKYIVVPPSIKIREELSIRFLDAVDELMTLHDILIGENEHEAALYATPQSVAITTIRSYNLFNLVYPMGFIATRTCSKAQWEERSIAYKIWQDIEKQAAWLSQLLGEKCKHLGYCPEREWCPIILKYREYTDDLHQKYFKGFMEKK